MEEKEEEEQGSVFDRIQPVRHEEPTDPATSTRLGFRLSDGSRLTHRFSKDAPVRVLFEFIKAEVEDARSQPFDVRSNGKKWSIIRRIRNGCSTPLCFISIEPTVP